MVKSPGEIKGRFASLRQCSFFTKRSSIRANNATSIAHSSSKLRITWLKVAVSPAKRTALSLICSEQSSDALLLNLFCMHARNFWSLLQEDWTSHGRRSLTLSTRRTSAAPPVHKGLSHSIRQPPTSAHGNSPKSILKQLGTLEPCSLPSSSRGAAAKGCVQHESVHLEASASEQALQNALFEGRLRRAATTN